MKGSAAKIKVMGFDELFGVPADTGEQIQEIALVELHPFRNHPFRVIDDAHMQETVESVKTYGVLVPGIVRPRAEGGYEIISGHRRKRAAELAGLDTMPVLVREMDDDNAVIYMVDSNLQREEILPSERAAAYKMKLEAIKRQGSRRDLTSPQGSAKFRSDDMVAQEDGVSGDTVRRYIRLTELSPELQQKVDEKKIALSPAVELSYLSPEEQALLVETIDSEQATPSLSQAQRLRKESRAGSLNEDTMLAVMSEIKKPEATKLVLTTATLNKYFPKDYTPKRMENVILTLLEGWMKQRQTVQ